MTLPFFQRSPRICLTSLIEKLEPCLTANTFGAGRWRGWYCYCRWSVRTVWPAHTNTCVRSTATTPLGRRHGQ